MRVLIVDDEPLARDALIKILRANVAVKHFDSADDAIDAQEYLSKQGYDVILLGISMPEISGLDLLVRLQQGKRSEPSVVFVTAYAEHALAAFEKHAVDYILKPFSDQRVNEALEFASRRTANERAAKLLELMPYLHDIAQKHPSRIGIKINRRFRFIDPHQIVAVEAEGNYVLLQKESGSDLLRESISAVADKLKLYGFIRIHRSVLVNASFVQDVRPCSTGEHVLRMKGGKQYTVTRTYKDNLASMARCWLGCGGTTQERESPSNP